MTHPETVSPYVTAARRLAAEQLVPNAARVDREAAYPADTVKAMAASGLCALTIPKEYGGNLVDNATVCRVLEELARGCPSTAGVLAAWVVGSAPLVTYGSPEQKASLLPDLAAGKRSVCFAITEPHTGSDIAAIRTTARRDGDGWLINGHKALIGNAVGAHVCVVAAKTDPDAGHRGVSAFIVDARTPGLKVSHVYEKMGMRGTTTGEISLNDVRVPADALLGPMGKGSTVFLKSLDLGRFTVAAQAVGIAQAALELATAYAKQRVTFGEPLSQRQAIQFKLADMAVAIHASRTMLYDGCRKLDAGAAVVSEAAMAKLYASEAAAMVTDEAVQIFGGWGVVDRPRVEALYRDARYLRIWEGASEIQRLVIARHVLAAEPAA